MLHQWTRGIYLMGLVVALSAPSSIFCKQTAEKASEPVPQASPVHKTKSQTRLTTTIKFEFEILDIETDHQFQGQRNSFHVAYEYAGVYRGGAFDPAGHSVAPDTFPYFQKVRNEIIDFVENYKNRENFYELFGTDICRNILGRYPQIRRIEMKIDVPAFADVGIDRHITITMEQKKNLTARF